MNETPRQASIWHSVAVVWRLERRRLWSIRQVLGFLVTGVVLAALALNLDAVVELGRSTLSIDPLPSWWPAALEVFFPERADGGRLYALFTVLRGDGSGRDSATVGYLSDSVLHAWQHYLLPGIAAAALTARDEKWRVDALRHGGVRPAGLLAGKCLGVLTPMLLAWLALAAWRPAQGAGHAGAVALFSSATLCLLVMTAALGLCAGAVVRQPTVSIGLAYVLCWGVSFATRLAAHRIVYGEARLGLTTPAESCAGLLAATGWIGVAVGVPATVLAFVVAHRCLARRPPPLSAT